MNIQFMAKYLGTGLEENRDDSYPKINRLSPTKLLSCIGPIQISSERYQRNDPKGVRLLMTSAVLKHSMYEMHRS